jgi:hypothetical protein
MNKPVCELPKNSREVYYFRLGEFKGHKFLDMRIFTIEEGKEPAPTKKAWLYHPNCGRNSGPPWPRWKRP